MSKKRKHTCLLHMTLAAKPGAPAPDWWTPEQTRTTKLKPAHVEARIEAMTWEADEPMVPRRIPGTARWVLWFTYKADDDDFQRGGIPAGPFMDAMRTLAEAAAADLRLALHGLEETTRDCGEGDGRKKA